MEVKKMLDRGDVIEPAQMEWAALIMFAPKNGGFVTVPHVLSKVEQCDLWSWYPITRMNECIDSLGDATIFSMLGTNSDYWPMETAEEDTDKTAF